MTASFVTRFYRQEIDPKPVGVSGDGWTEIIRWVPGQLWDRLEEGKRRD